MMAVGIGTVSVGAVAGAELPRKGGVCIVERLGAAV
jgi:hypothetical protein